MSAAAPTTDSRMRRCPCSWGRGTGWYVATRCVDGTLGSSGWKCAVLLGSVIAASSRVLQKPTPWIPRLQRIDSSNRIMPAGRITGRRYRSTDTGRQSLLHPSSGSGQPTGREPLNARPPDAMTAFPRRYAAANCSKTAKTSSSCVLGSDLITCATTPSGPITNVACRAPQYLRPYTT